MLLWRSNSGTNQAKPKAPFEKPANRNAVEDLPLLYEMIALALQSDSTRIATLEIGGDFMPQHLGIKKDWHGLSHHGNDPEAIADLVPSAGVRVRDKVAAAGKLKAFMLADPVRGVNIKKLIEEGRA